MQASLIKFIFVYLPLGILLLIQALALLALYAGEISGKDETMIALGTHVQAIRWGWPLLFVIAIAYRFWNRRGAAHCESVA